MAVGDPYAELASLKSWFKIGDTADDSELQIAVDSASRGIEDHCHRQFNDAGSATARVYQPESKCWVVVDDFSTTTGLIVKTDEDDDGVYETTWSASEFEVRPVNGVVNGRPGYPYWEVRTLGSRYFPTTVQRPAVQVTARWGWAAVPKPVEQACLILAAEGFKLKDAPFGVAGFSEFGAVRVRDNPVVARMLAEYVRDSWLLVQT